MNRIDIRIANGICSITSDACIEREEDVQIRVSMPRLTEVANYGAGDIKTMKPFTQPVSSFIANLYGSGDINYVSNMETNVSTSIEGRGNIFLSGYSSGMDVVLKGAGELHATNYSSKRVAVTSSGNGNAYLLVCQHLRVDLKSSGSVYYYGESYLRAGDYGIGASTIFLV